MAGFWDRVLGNPDKSADKAKERLKLVLIHDRTDIPSGTIQSLKDELIQVISRHIDIDPDAVRIDIAHEGREQRLVADIPLRQDRRHK